MVFLGLPFFYETLLLLHHCLYVVLLYSLWQFLGPKNRIYLTVAIIVYGVLTGIRTMRLVWRTYSWSRGWSRARIHQCNDALIVTIFLPRPIVIKEGLAGRYLYITIPELSNLSLFQRHPFSICWWSEASDGLAGSVSLLVLPRHGFTRRLVQYAGADSSLKLLVDGPYGRHVDTSAFRTIIAIATGTGIAAILPIIKQAMQEHYRQDGRVKRMLLIWQPGQKGSLDLSFSFSCAYHFRRHGVDERVDG